MEEQEMLSLLSRVDVSEVDAVSKALMEVAAAEGKEGQVLRRLVAEEFERHREEPNQILRQQTLVSRAMGAHARRLGGT